MAGAPAAAKKKRVVVRKKATAVPWKQYKKLVLKELVSLPDDVNPRRGDIDAIAASIRETAQWDDIIVQRSHGGEIVPKAKGRMLILAGNHTTKAMTRRLKWTEADCTIINCDDKTARKIIIAANHIPNLGSIEEEIMGRMLMEMDDLVGTGVDDEYANELIAMAQEAMEDNRSLMESVADEMAGVADDGLVTDDGDELDHPTNAILYNDDEDKFEQQPEQLQTGAMKMDDEILFMEDDATGFWQIPKLRMDRIPEMSDLPKKLATWAGTATRDNDDPDQWWLWNFGVDSTSGMKQSVNQIILSFYTYDQYFERWWYDAGRYVSKILNSGIEIAIQPDFSPMNDEPRMLSLYNYYRNFWLARFMQEAGVNVIPNVSWPYMAGQEKEWYQFIEDEVIPLYPKGAPLVATQMQTFDHNQSAQELRDLRRLVKRVFTEIDPQAVLLYSGEAGRKFWESCKLGIETRFIEHRATALTERARKRERKNTF